MSDNKRTKRQMTDKELETLRQSLLERKKSLLIALNTAGARTAEDGFAQRVLRQCPMRSAAAGVRRNMRDLNIYNSRAISGLPPASFRWPGRLKTEIFLKLIFLSFLLQGNQCFDACLCIIYNSIFVPYLRQGVIVFALIYKFK